MHSREVIALHEESGRHFTAGGVGSFVLDAGAGEPDALGLDRFHLVVHDIGGPIGFELAAAIPQRVASLTILTP